MPRRSTAESNPPHAPRSRRIVVVDDHEPFRAAICQLLGKRGYTATHFASVKEFVASDGLRTTDCLLLDIMMPEIGGLTLKECLDQTNYGFPVIFCTGLAPDEIDPAMVAGARVLQKPIPIETLIAAIEEAGQPVRTKR